MAFENDTLTDEAQRQVGTSGNQPGSGNAGAPGGSSAPAQSAHEQTHGGDAYPGPRSGGNSGSQESSGVAAGTGKQTADATYGAKDGAPVDEAVATTGDALSGGVMNGDAGVNSRSIGGADETGNETGLNSDTPVAADVDPDATRSAEETGQDGDPRAGRKSTGHPWNG